jgi:hypothetical protein
LRAERGAARGLRPQKARARPRSALADSFLADESGVAASEYAGLARLKAVFIVAAACESRRSGQRGVQRSRWLDQVRLYESFTVAARRRGTSSRSLCSGSNGLAPEI